MCCFVVSSTTVYTTTLHGVGSSRQNHKPHNTTICLWAAVTALEFLFKWQTLHEESVQLNTLQCMWSAADLRPSSSTYCSNFQRRAVYKSTPMCLLGWWTEL